MTSILSQPSKFPCTSNTWFKYGCKFPHSQQIPCIFRPPCAQATSSKTWGVLLACKLALVRGRIWCHEDLLIQPSKICCAESSLLFQCNPVWKKIGQSTQSSSYDVGLKLERVRIPPILYDWVPQGSLVVGSSMLVGCAPGPTCNYCFL